MFMRSGIPFMTYYCILIHRQLGLIYLGMILCVAIVVAFSTTYLVVLRSSPHQLRSLAPTTREGSENGRINGLEVSSENSFVEKLENAPTFGHRDTGSLSQKKPSATQGCDGILSSRRGGINRWLASLSPTEPRGKEAAEAMVTRIQDVAACKCCLEEYCFSFLHSCSILMILIPWADALSIGLLDSSSCSWHYGETGWDRVW